MTVQKLCVYAFAAFLLFSGSVFAQNEFEPQLRGMFEGQVQPILSMPILVDAVRAQNDEHAGLSDADIAGLDAEWRESAGTGHSPLVDAVLSHELSAFLRSIQDESNGQITEIFVMDNRGLNVGQSVITSDYMQGDEAKWQRTFLQGPDAVFVDELEFDDSTSAFQSQVSGTIVDPETGEPIGAITVGVNVETLL